MTSFRSAGTESLGLPARVASVVVFCLASFLAASVASADGGLVQIPVRWCAVDGSPAVRSPETAPANFWSGLPETSTDGVLWRRHERSSEFIYIPSAAVTFRSAFTEKIREQANFPVVADPCPPVTGNACQSGASAGLRCSRNTDDEDPVACGAGVVCGLRTYCQGGGRDGFVCTPDGSGESPVCGAGIACETMACPGGCPACLDNTRPGDVVDPTFRVCVSGSTRGDSCTIDETTGESPDCDAGTLCRTSVELDLVKSICRDAWDELAGANDENLIGPLVVNVGRWTGYNSRVFPRIVGIAWPASVNGGANVCAAPPTNLSDAIGGELAVQDNQITKDDPDDNVLSHELGHVLRLTHGNGRDDDGDLGQGGGFDECDADEDVTADPPNLMRTGLGVIATEITELQAELARAVAEVHDTAQEDPPALLIPGPVMGAERTDPPRDVVDEGVDIVWVRIVEDDATDTSTFVHGLFGRIPQDFGLRRYSVLMDLDGDPATGGTVPADLELPTSFEGAELLTMAFVSTRSAPSPAVYAWASVYRLVDGVFELCDPVEDAECAEISAEVLSPEAIGDGEDSAETLVTSDLVRIRLPNSVRGAISDRPRFQALAEQLEPPIIEILSAETETEPLEEEEFEFDRLPGGAGGGLASGARVLPFSSPVFPVCQVLPNLVEPGGTAEVEASGLLADSMVKVFLGDRRVASGTTDSDGDVLVEFPVPVTSNAQESLVTVGVAGLALTADCSVTVLEGPPIILTPETSVNEVGQDHTVTAAVVDDDHEPLVGVEVTFSVDAGPNAGVAGVCSFNEDCTTDDNGHVFFTHSGAGGDGVDQISASFEDAAGEVVVSNQALKFWETDCNQNNVADRCDVDCDGFDGLCSAYPTCGEKEDENGDGFPDECNRPPDCSLAGAEPDELWPPNHKYRDIVVAGVTDEDADPVEIEITSIFQDEPVNGRGDGDQQPDGSGVGGSIASVRAERSGSQETPGDGRVYHIGFVGDDGRGGVCEGEVTVCVPHDKSPRSDCVDQGALYDSTFDGSACGLGFELVLALPPLCWLMTKRRRRR